MASVRHLVVPTETVDEIEQQMIQVILKHPNTEVKTLIKFHLLRLHWMILFYSG